MADRTPNELADRLSIEHQHPSPSGKIGLCQCPQCPDLRAAAALLRRQGEQLDTLRAAIGDPDELRWHRWHCEETGQGDDLRELLVRIADAAAVAEAAEDRGQTDG